MRKAKAVMSLSSLKPYLVLVALMFLPEISIAAPPATRPTSAPTTAPATQPVWPDPRYTVGEVLVRDDFENLDNWTCELEKGGTVAAVVGRLDIDVPGGCTVWLKKPLEGNVLIEYEVTVAQNGGPNDRVSDLNCFWMARDTRCPEDLFAKPRSGKFSDYDQLMCYYVGLGGNSNTTTRFRRYIGEKDNRPLLPENDLSDPSTLITANVPQVVRAVAYGNTVQFFRDATRLFEVNDDHPYQSGWFGFRTVNSHLYIRNFRVYRLLPAETSKPNVTK